MSGSGNGAVLVPVISNGVITEVKVNNSGFNYLEKDTTVTVDEAGDGDYLNSIQRPGL